MELSPAELAFLRSQGHGPEDVFDARGLPSRYWKRAAKSNNKPIVLGSPCKAAGHRLRTRAGHCIQCDTKKLAYLKRYDDPGYVYIAGSLSARVVKIGTSINIRQRERKLRFDGDGGINDWKILFSVWVENGGRSEDRALTQLSKFRRSRSFFKDGVQQNATEILDCSFSVAFNAVRSVVGEDLMSKAWTSIYHRRYDFE